MLKSMTRVLVLSGVVTLTTAMGSIEGTAGDLLAAEPGKAPTKLTVQANSGFAVDLYQQLSKEEGNVGKNLLFSPYSISSALAMTMEGARGQTMKEMGEVLHFPAQAQRTGGDAQRLPWETSLIHTGFAQLNERFNRKDKPYQLSVANALWGKIGYPWDPAYVDKLNKSYKTGGIFPMDFAGDPDGSRRYINKWVEDRTEERIKELIPPPEIDSGTALVLTNAIYFKGNWARPFDKRRTRILDFTREDRSTVKVPIMSREFSLRVGSAQLGRDNYVTLFELPYVGEDLSMVLINGRPNLYGRSNLSLKTIEKYLTAENLDKWLRTLRKEDGVAVRLPRFKMELEYKLNPTLKAMGMPTAFRAADFNGLTTSPNDLSISAVLHKGFIEVNEEGTEAAGATAVMLKESVRPKFDGSRPFIYLIRDNKSGSILFMGRVMDPTEN